MTWVKLDDNFAQHPKVLGLSDAAFRAHVTALCYAARHEQDGAIGATTLPFITGKSMKSAAKLISELVAAGLWEVREGEYVIHDYLEYNPSAENLKEQRRSASVRMNNLRSSRRVSEVFNDPVPSRPLPRSQLPTAVSEIVALAREEPTAAEGSIFDLWRDTFGKPAPALVTNMLLHIAATHPFACQRWAFEQTAMISKPTFKYTERILIGCDNEGHGPRTKQATGARRQEGEPVYAGDGERAASYLRSLEAKSAEFFAARSPGVAPAGAAGT